MSTSLEVKSESPRSLDADAVVVGYHSGADGPVPASGAHDVDSAFSGGLGAALTLLGATAAVEEVRTVPALGAVAAPVVVAVGLGPAPADGESVPADTVARAAGAALRSLRGKSRVVLALPAETGELAAAAALGALLGGYSFDRYRTGSEQAPLESLTVVSGAADAAEAVRRAEVLASSVGLARDLVNTAPADLCPADLAGIAEQVGRDSGLDVTVLNEKALVEGGYGGIVGVGQGSANPPRLVRLSYSHPEAAKTLALVGKGITFDSGGISIKPAQAMDEMKYDMCGAASVLGTMRAIAELGLPLNVIGVVPSCENLPDGAATKPGDIITSMSGQTIEVLNTDAEGRLILCDALTYSERFEPDAVIDIATLTGACVIALGHAVHGLMGNHNPLIAELLAAGKASGDRAWELPLLDDYQDALKSNFADMANVGDRSAGAITAACFLSRFAGKFRWAHLDIAGTAWKAGKEKGATGRPVPLLTQFLLNRAAKA